MQTQADEESSLTKGQRHAAGVAELSGQVQAQSLLQTVTAQHAWSKVSAAATR